MLHFSSTLIRSHLLGIATTSTALLFSNIVKAQTPLASRCHSLLEAATQVACVNNHAAVMPPPFSRPLAENLTALASDSFRYITVPSDPSFELVRNSTFIVFDEERGAQILGPSPRYDFIFASDADSVHEAPVYVPAMESIIYSLARQGVYEQQLVNLTDPGKPTLRDYTTNPPVYAVNGGKFWRGHVYWAAEAGVPFPDPSDPSRTVLQAPGIYRLDPGTGQVETLLNNYYGTQLNSPNDLWVDGVGDIWFTDGWYGYGINVSATPPPNSPTTYRFRPSTRQMSVVEDSIAQPNGIAFSTDERTAFITDSGVDDFRRPPPDGQLPRYSLNRYGGNSVYAFDVQWSPAGNYLVNKRPIWKAQEFSEDGFHVSREGYILGAAGEGVDVFTAYGEYLVRIYTNFTVNNVQFAGTDLSDLWLFGIGGIARVKWNLHGTLEE